MTATMKASYLLKQGELSVREVAIPTLTEDEVLVRVAAVGVCGSDVHYYQHGKIGPYVVNHPLILGHELSGTIEADSERQAMQQLKGNGLLPREIVEEGGTLHCISQQQPA